VPDRNHNYVPDGLYLDGNPQYTEIRGGQPASDAATDTDEAAWGIIANVEDWTTQRPDWQAAAARWRDHYHHRLERYVDAQPTPGRIAHVSGDGPAQWWADVSGDGTHWSHFRGHRIQVDIKFHTWNERDVNQWKGRDEISASGTWQLCLNRQPICDGHIGDDPFAALRHIEDIARKFMNHPAINWYDNMPVAEQLLGRRVYYERTPAVVSYVSTLHQGCVGLKPVGVDLFPPSAYQLDEDGGYDQYDRDEIKVNLLSSDVWWWRRRLVEGVESPEVTK
jgi:hypothetical protein